MRQDLAVQDVVSLISARNTLLWIVSGEETRVERALIGVAGQLKQKSDIRFWDCADGMQDAAGKTLDARLTDPLAALDFVKSTKQRCIYVFRDLHKWMDPQVLRKLRSLQRQLQGVPSDEARTVIVLSSSTEVPPELEGTPVKDWPLPDREEMGTILDDVVESTAFADALDNGERDAAIDAVLGLSAEEAYSSFAKSLVTTKTIDPAVVSAEKKRVIERERVLTWHDPDPRGLDAIGGLDVLKDWLVERKAAFSSKARDYGLPAPKGVMLVGPPGTGKSLTAKAIGTAWGQPLLRLDLGALRSKYVGDSEANIRKALSRAESVAPCILWVDEIEKALAGASGPQGDGGVSSDALGAILSWMQERAGSVFVVATANDVEALPPELLRKGRFDELFFIDLPTSSERPDVLSAALAHYGRDAADVLKPRKQVDALVQATDGFTGAEIDAVIPDALFHSFSDGERELTAADLLSAIEQVVPLSKTAGDKITKLQDWAKGRARPASKPETAASGPTRRIEV